MGCMNYISPTMKPASGDPTDVMGSSSNAGFAAMAKHYLQVIDDAEIIDLASSVEGNGSRINLRVDEHMCPIFAKCAS